MNKLLVATIAALALSTQVVACTADTETPKQEEGTPDQQKSKEAQDEASNQKAWEAALQENEVNSCQATAGKVGEVCCDFRCYY